MFHEPMAARPHDALALAQAQGSQDRASTSLTTVTVTPPEPHPSADFAASSYDPQASHSTPQSQHDAYKPLLSSLPASEALKLLSTSIELLVRMTGDVPPTPPLKTPTNPQMSDMQNEKTNIARSLSEKSLSRMREVEKGKDEVRRKQRQQQQGQPPPSHNREADKMQEYREAMKAQVFAQQQQTTSSTFSSPPPPPMAAIDGVQLRKNSLITSPASSTGSQPEPYIIIGADSQPVNRQHGAITRKFYSKNEPPIPIAQYLLRLHQFCPMSTAVYLATSLYIHRLAVEERAIPVTRRNAHRLVLAGLRVAMKALEDLSYPHGKIAKVGGVSEAELARLEISFCFLAGFELMVREEHLWRHWMVLREGKAGEVLGRIRDGGVGELRIERRRKELELS